MSQPPLMPKATALWLVQNTKLTFKQIATFCHLHPLEVENLADEAHLVPFDPVTSGQLTKEEVERCENNTEAELKITTAPLILPKKKTRYIPIAKRSDRPNAISWLIKRYPFIPDKEIVKLLGTTSKMVQSIRDKSYWNIEQVNPSNPVLLGLCTNEELHTLIERYHEKEEESTQQS